MITSCGIADDDGLFNCERGEGEKVARTLDITDFSGVELDIAADVYITQGDTYEVIAEGQDNILNELEARVEGNVWHIKFDDCVRNYDGLDIFITMPEIDYLSVDGSGDIIGENFFEIEDIEMKICGSGNIDIGIEEGDDIDAKISGSGKIKLEGTAQKLDFKISGSGDLRAFDLELEKADINISGSGDAEVFVTDDLDIKITGSGDVYYKGNPDIDVSITGSGDVVNAN